MKNGQKKSYGFLSLTSLISLRPLNNSQERQYSGWGKFWRRIFFLVLVTTTSQQPVLGEVSKRYFDLQIDSSELSVALDQLARVTGMQLIYSEEDIRSATSNKVTGSFTVDEALRVLLAGTELSGGLTKSGVIVISSTRPEERDMKINKSTTLLGSLFALFLGADGALGQSDTQYSANGQQVIEEIVVTARRRDENVQHVPLAVTAFTAEALETKGVDSVKDLMFVSPSLTALPSFSQLSGGFALRGQFRGVTTYFNEVPIGSSGEAGTAQPFFDVASVQVLNGPQGTLFGRANTAGAILVSSNRVNLNEFEANFSATMGDYSRVDFGGMVNLPIIDNQLGVRLAVNRERRDGFVGVVNSSEELHENNSDSARLSVDWVAGDSGFANFTTLSYYKVDQAPRPNVLTGYNPAFGIFNLPPSTDTFLGGIIGPIVFGGPCNVAVSTGLSPDMNTCVDGRLRTAASIAPRLQAELERIQRDGVREVLDIPGMVWRERMEQLFLVNNMEYDFGDLGPTTLVANYIFGYKRTRGQGAFANDGAGGIVMQNYFFGSAGAWMSTNTVDGVAVPGMGPWAKNYSHELRLSGTFGDDLVRWTVGGYLERSPVAKSTRGSANYFRLFDGILAPDLGFTPVNVMRVGGSGARQEAFFAEATINLSSLVPAIQGLHLTLGGRRSDDENEVEGRAEVSTYPSGFVVPGAASVTRTESDGDNTNITLDAQLTDGLLVYLASREGYRPGGFNDVQGADGLPLYSPIYGPELVEDIELGAKYNYSLGKASGYMNVAFYRSDYTDIHRSLTATPESGGLAVYTANVAAAEIDGVEVLAALSLGNWDFDASFSYTDAAYTDYKSSDPFNLILSGDPRCLPESPAALCLIDLDGDPFLATPKKQASLTARYQLPLADSLGDLSLAVTASYRSKMYIGQSPLRQKQEFPDDESRFTIDSSMVVNLRVEWLNVIGTNVDAAFFIDNVNDETYAVDGLFLHHLLGFSSKAYGDPRTYGLSLSMSF